MSRNTFYKQYRYLKVTAKGYTKKRLLVPESCMKVLGEFDSIAKLKKARKEDIFGEEKMTYGRLGFRIKKNPYFRRKLNIKK